MKSIRHLHLFSSTNVFFFYFIYRFNKFDDIRIFLCPSFSSELALVLPLPKFYRIRNCILLCCYSRLKDWSKEDDRLLHLESMLPRYQLERFETDYNARSKNYKVPSEDKEFETGLHHEGHFRYSEHEANRYDSLHRGHLSLSLSPPSRGRDVPNYVDESPYT